MELRAIAPDTWARFVTAVHDHSLEQTSRMVACAPEMLLRAQGMAIAADEIATALIEAPKLHAKMQEKRHG